VKSELRAWTLLAVAALGLAGVMALLLGLSRTPVVGDWLPWGPSFFRRALVTHVVLSFQVWFLALLGALSCLAAPPGRLSDGLGRAGFFLAAGGVVLLLLPALADQGEPSLNNYVPVVVHPLFACGLALLGGGVALACVRALRWWPDPVRFGIASAGLSYFAALACIAIAWVRIPPGTAGAQFNEVLFWAGGHVLQIVNTIMLLVAWQALSERLWARGPLAPDVARAAFAALALFAVASPLVALKGEVLGVEYRQAFTRLLWLGLPLSPLVMGAGLALRLIKGGCDRASPAFVALSLSLLVFAIGGLAGFFLGEGDTRTPSHYHAMIGGVQLGLMAVVLLEILPRLGRPAPAGRAVFLIYGGGQMVHAMGFFLAGSAGVPRKVSGAAQGLDSLFKLLSMGAVGLGAGLAVVGGALFVWLALVRLLGGKAKL
jgi:hypothetical protein